jgi:uncharacterized delta-60 repeat protein
MTDLDLTFNNPNGFVLTDFFHPPSDTNLCKVIALQPDGKIVMAGNSQNLLLDVFVALCRYNADGTLDSSFGVNGLVTTLIPPLSSSPSLNTCSLAIQQDGKIVVCGTRENSTGFQEMFITRFTSNGELDTATFASPNGYIFITPSMFNTEYFPGTVFDNCYATSVKIDTTTNPNKIIIGGHVSNVVNGLSFLSLIKLDFSGALDNTFGINGSGLFAINFSGIDDEYGLCLAVTSSGEYLLGGAEETTTISKMVVAKFNSSGSPNTLFGSNGISVIPTSSSFEEVSEASSIAIQQDGNIVLGGTAILNSNVSCYTVARLFANNGNLDNSFGNGGQVITNFSLSNYNLAANSIGIQSDGKIIMGGTYEYMITNPTSNGFSLARYDTNGLLDSSFGINGNGLILEDLIPGGFNDVNGYSLAIQSDGKIILGGESGDYSNKEDDAVKSFILARYLPSQVLPLSTPLLEYIEHTPLLEYIEHTPLLETFIEYTPSQVIQSTPLIETIIPVLESTPPEPTTTCINTCNNQNNKCTYSDYSTFLNSKTTCRPVNQKTYKSYSSGGFKGSKGSPNSYLNSIPLKFCANYAEKTETSPYLRYSDLSKCCKFVCKSFTSTTPSS